MGHPSLWRDVHVEQERSGDVYDGGHQVRTVGGRPRIARAQQYPAPSLCNYLQWSVGMVTTAPAEHGGLYCPFEDNLSGFQVRDMIGWKWQGSNDRNHSRCARLKQESQTALYILLVKVDVDGLSNSLQQKMMAYSSHIASAVLGRPHLPFPFLHFSFSLPFVRSFSALY